MLSNLVQLAHQIENKVCRFICDNDTPISVIKEALFQFQKYVGAIEDAAKAQQAQKEAESASNKEQIESDTNSEQKENYEPS